MAPFDHIKLFCVIKLTLQSVKVSSSSKSSLLFAIVYWCETNRSSLLQMLFKIDVLKNFTYFTGKHLCWSLFLINLQAWRRLQHRCFPVKFATFLKTPSFTEDLWWLLLNKPRRSLWFIVWWRNFWSFSISVPWLSNIMLNLLTKSSFNISLMFKLKYAAILHLS